MREPDVISPGKWAVFGMCSVMLDCREELFWIPSNYMTERSARAVVADLAAAIEWYERRQADSEEGR